MTVPRVDRQTSRLERLEAQIAERSVQVRFLMHQWDPEGNTLTPEQALIFAFDELLGREREMAHRAERAYQYAYDVRQTRIRLVITAGLASATLASAIVAVGFLVLG